MTVCIVVAFRCICAVEEPAVNRFCGTVVCGFQRVACIRDCQGFKRSALIEDIALDLSNTVTDDSIFEICTAHKCLIADDSDRGRNIDSRNAETVVECLYADDGQRVREIHFAELCSRAVVECIMTNAGNSLRNRQIRNLAAVIECVFADACDVIRIDDLFEIDHVAEAVVRNDAAAGHCDAGEACGDAVTVCIVVAFRRICAVEEPAVNRLCRAVVCGFQRVAGVRDCQ